MVFNYLFFTRESIKYRNNIKENCVKILLFFFLIINNLI